MSLTLTAPPAPPEIEALPAQRLRELESAAMVYSYCPTQEAVRALHLAAEAYAGIVRANAYRNQH